MPLNRILTLILLFAYGLGLKAQDLNKGFFHIEHGDLSSKSVSSILRDVHGFMWFGTSEGLCRYDGTNVKIYKHHTGDSTSLSHNEVNVIIEDPHQNLWIGTANGLNLYNRDLDSFVNVDNIAKGKTGLSSHFITALAADKNNQIWIGTMGGGLDIFNVTSSTFSHHLQASQTPNKASTHVNAIHITENYAWVATRYGIKILDIRTRRFFSLKNDIVDDTEVSCLTLRKGHSVLAGYANGKIRELSFDGKELTKNDIGDIKTITGPTSYIHEIALDNAEHLWVITEKSGMLLIDIRSKAIQQFLPEEGNIRSAPALSMRTAYCDNEQRIWVGTYNSGVYTIDRRAKRFQLYQRNPLTSETLKDNHVRAFAEDQNGDIWIATNKGLDRFSLKTRKMNTPVALSKIFGNRMIKDIIVDQENNLWLGTRDEGVVQVNLKTLATKTYEFASGGIGNNKTMCLYQDREGRIWIGSLGSGLFYLDRRLQKFVSLCEKDKPNFIPENAYVSSILEDSNGTLWIGTLHGLFALDGDVGNYAYEVFYQHNNRSKISSSRIMSLCEDQRHRLWVGTFDNGLNLFHKASKTFMAYTEESGLANNSIKGIISDSHGNLWLSSNGGISQFNPETAQVRNFMKEDGLNSNTFNAGACLQTGSGHLFFGGDNGFNIVHADSSTTMSTPPVMFLTDLRINNKTVRVGEKDSPLNENIMTAKELSLSYDQRQFAIDFVALNYGPPGKNQYCYRLEGFEENWNCIGSDRTATYTNIDPGEYKFYVKATNGDGIASVAPATLRIIVHPPLWKTWWAKLLYGVFGFSLIYIFLRIRSERIRIKNQLKLEKLAREKEHELAEAKMHFFNNISHELRTPLSLIYMPLEKIVDTPDTPDHLTHSLTTAYKHAANLMKLVNELMDLAKFDEIKPRLNVHFGEVLRFVTEVASSFNDIVEQKSIRMSLTTDATEIYGWFDSEKLEKVIRNILSNALKFTPERGEIRITIGLVGSRAESGMEDRRVHIAIADNGIGISPDDLPRIFDKFFQAQSASAILHSGTGIGLSLTKMLVEVHRGTIRVESTPGEGSIFHIEIPIERKGYYDDEIVASGHDDRKSETGATSQEYEHIVIDSNIGKPELLIIEDNDELREFLVAEFTPDFSVVAASTGDAGFDLACEHIPDLIISDIVLPGRTGLALCKEIKSDLRTSHIPVILLTAKTSSHDQVNGLESGADVYMPKPFSLRVLQAHVKQIILERKKLYAKYSQDAYLMPASLADNAVDREFLQKAVDYIDHNLRNSQLSVESIADLFNISRSQVYRKIKALTGQTVVEFIRTIRLKHALRLMEDKKYTFSEIADQSGFNSLSYFTRSFKDQYGKTPSEYVDGSKS